jgi:predicted phage gp36 major capsid-like protein
MPCDFSKVEKKTNNAKLNEAFEIAAQGYDLAWFKNSFKEAADNLAKEAKEQAAKDKKAAAKASPEKKRTLAKVEEAQDTKRSKGKRKSRATADDEDEESAEADADAMDLDEDEAKVDPKPKSKKRKKEDSDVEDAKVSTYTHVSHYL